MYEVNSHRANATIELLINLPISKKKRKLNSSVTIFDDKDGNYVRIAKPIIPDVVNSKELVIPVNCSETSSNTLFPS